MIQMPIQCALVVNGDHYVGIRRAASSMTQGHRLEAATTIIAIAAGTIAICADNVARSAWTASRRGRDDVVGAFLVAIPSALVIEHEHYLAFRPAASSMTPGLRLGGDQALIALV